MEGRGRKDAHFLETDLLVIGSGFAGLWAAITARDEGVEDVALVDKGAIGLSSQSRMAAGATIFRLPGDHGEEWLGDFAEAHGYLCRQDMVAEILETSRSRLEKLERWGVGYERLPIGSRYLTLPSRGLRHARMLVKPSWKGKRGGSAVVGALLDQVKARKVAFHPKILVTSLLASGGRVCGAVGVRRITGEPVVFRARAVVLAAADCSFRGNYACVDAATGDAFRLAFEAGARLTNMEFLVVNTGSPSYGFEGTGVATLFGARFLDRSRRRFLREHHPDADRAEICHIVQAMAKEAARGNGPPFTFDMSRLPGRILTRRGLLGIGGWMPLHLRRLEETGLDIFRSPQDWAPAIQSLRGGVRTDIDCTSDLPGLFAAGTSQSIDPGMFNGWSSMRAMWSGERAGSAAARFLGEAGPPRAPDTREEELRIEQAIAPSRRNPGLRPDEVCARLQQVLFPAEVCILKRQDRLAAALAEVVRIREEEVPALSAEDPHDLAKAHETESMALAAELFLRASIERKESRGDHFREDFPEAGPTSALAWVNWRKGPGGEPLVEREPVPLSSYPLRPACAPAGAAGGKAASGGRPR